ncbi:MobA-like NTP transferase domain-containing protein [Bryocella elongata]|uniref:MobA-like NTP transferase domain-containing protein n=1 Tax=Bryocella elongata TaxID=863522 RepID=A0A1H5SPS5_9BACT|nr:sugar phosphate nucleotidyltransferase [Bryocella elongata]SEF52613.1 MobA-like NTP transferase domain-containing protein [Bryocella elongata]
MPEAELPPIAILCGGLATRLGALTAGVPKSLLPIAGEPFLAHQLRLLAASGFREVVLLCGHLSEPIRAFAGDGSSFGCHVRYSEDGPVLLGTGGAVRKALPLLGERFVLLYGDSYCVADYRAIDRAFVASMKLSLMTVFRNRNQFDRSNVEYADGMILRYDKRSSDDRLEYIDYGVNAFRAEAFAGWEEGPFDLSALQADLLHRGELAGYEVPERFYEIGSVAGIESTEELLRSRAGTREPLIARND